jgi:hypothetical protein
MDRFRTSVPLLWIVATVGFPIGGLLAQSIAGPAATVPAGLLSGLIAGAIIGLAQGIALGRRDQALVLWVTGTAVALGVALAGVTMNAGLIATTGTAVGLGIVSGVLIGAAQAVLLQRAGVANAWAWIPITTLAWAVGWFITASVGVALAPGWPVYGASGAIVSQIITAVALWRVVGAGGSLQAAR